MSRSTVTQTAISDRNDSSSFIPLYIPLSNMFIHDQLRLVSGIIFNVIFNLREARKVGEGGAKGGS